MTITALFFEGGPLAGPLSRDMARIREVALGLRVQRLAAAGVHRVAIVSDREDLRRQAWRWGASFHASLSPFHFGRQLAAFIEEAGPFGPEDWLVYLGGGAGIGLRVPDWEALLGHFADPREVWVNNPQSPDLLAFCPYYWEKEELPSTDNGLLYALMRGGYRRRLWPNTPALNFDVDTPADAALMALLASWGQEALDRPPLVEVLESLPWVPPLKERWRQVGHLLSTGGELILLGRVSPVAVLEVNARWPARLRVFSEERGMKALGRVERGEVRSLMGDYLRAVGPQTFFARMAEVAQGAILDTRVLQAHFRWSLTEEERFASDVGRPPEHLPLLWREFVRASQEAPMTVLLGGHTAVYGGIWWLAEELYRLTDRKIAVQKPKLGRNLE
ncbi:MAG: hypothetical protein KM310_05245 [Clostridiales bacterium]|nr:hypothetical protein [Clostridiales bacterium]